jgi:hypothetical protein
MHLPIDCKQFGFPDRVGFVFLGGWVSDLWRKVQIWRLSVRWVLGSLVVFGGVGCSKSDLDASLLEAIFLVVVMVVMAIKEQISPSAPKAHEGCDCDSCKRARVTKAFGMGVMARSLGVDVTRGDGPILEARSGGYVIRVREFGEEGDKFTVVELSVPSGREEFPVFLLRNSQASRLKIEEWEVVGFEDDKRFGIHFLLEVQVPPSGREGPEFQGLIARVRSMFTPELRTYLKFGNHERRWTLGARGHCLEAHLNRRWTVDEYEYRTLIAEAACILITLANRGAISKEVFESWRPGGHWLVAELLQGLLTGRGYSEVSLPRRAEEIAFHERWMAKGLRDSVTVTDGRYASLSLNLSGSCDATDFGISFSDRGLRRDLLQKRVEMDGYNALVVTVLVVLLPDSAPRLQRFRLGPRRRDLMEAESTMVFDIFSLKTCDESGAPVEDGSDGEWIECSQDVPFFSDALWIYLASEPVSSKGWFVEGFPGRLEIHRGCALAPEATAYSDFVTGATDVAVAIISAGRVTSGAVSYSSSPLDRASAFVRPEREQRYSRKGLNQTSSETLPASDRKVSEKAPTELKPTRVDFMGFEELLAKQHPGQMELLRQGLSAAQRREHLGKLYAEYLRTGVVPPL